MPEKLENFLISKKCPYRVFRTISFVYSWVSDLLVYCLTAALISGLWWFIWVA